MTASPSGDERNLRGRVIRIQDDSLVCDESKLGICSDEGREGSWNESINCCFGEVMLGRHLDADIKIPTTNSRNVTDRVTTLLKDLE